MFAKVALSSSLAVLCFLSASTNGQLAYHTDANTNSFTLKTPGLQQSFTRYFGGQGGNLQQQQQQQLQQQAQPQPQQYQQPQQVQVRSCCCLQQQQ